MHLRHWRESGNSGFPLEAAAAGDRVSRSAADAEGDAGDSDSEGAAEEDGKEEEEEGEGDDEADDREGDASTPVAVKEAAAAEEASEGSRLTTEALAGKSRTSASFSVDKNKNTHVKR